MPAIPADRLRTLATDLFRAAGTPEDIAAIAADAIVSSDLAGHDSHGVRMIPSYLDRIRAGELVPDARPKVVRETETTALLDAQGGHGHFAATVAMDLAVSRARDHHLGAVSLVNAGHIGRHGHYVARAAARDCIAVIARGNGGTSGTTAPYGGTRGALGSNPLAAAAPIAGRPPFVMDMATSVLSNGKVALARAAGQQLPPDAILTKTGEPSTDPNAGGPMLPFGGYKGYAISVLNMFLAGLGMTGAPIGTNLDSNFFLAIDVAAFQAADEYAARMAAYVDQLKSVPVQRGFDEIRLPGERSARSTAERTDQGVPVPDKVWAALQEAAAAWNVAV